MNKPEIAIVGGGIGGIASALALANRGFAVTVLEQANELREVGAGVQISANGARALDALGVYKAVHEVSFLPESNRYRVWNTGETWPMFALGADAEERYGYPYLTVYRPDLLAALAAGLERAAPGSLRLGARVSRVVMPQSPADRAAIELTTGERIAADIIVAADGVRSRVREQLFGDDHPAFSGMMAWRAVIPRDALPDGATAHGGTVWIGPGGHIVTYPLRGGALVNLIGVIERDDWREEGWSVSGTVEELLGDLVGWHPDLRATAAAADNLMKWALMEREVRPRWHHGPVVLLGDAAHATLPFLAQGAVMALEDAVVLARCLEAYPDFGAALAAFEAARIERTRQVVAQSRLAGQRYHDARLATPAGSHEFMTERLNAKVNHDQFDWLYSYDVLAVTI